ncbi:polyketide cyclase [Subtercola boreus]|uniref:Polyketide cyclase n=1 Tax=Subtercola boreus TaxID=120213 RepID=A0A3E0VVS4_9MICO|nr:SRPBCC domain-containing protein [Subtercola boreus]RFA13881.1 polyketide cyclase [Subtercola boreus]
MTSAIDPELDLVVSRVLPAPRSAVWASWADPRRFEQWWIPAPARCRVAEWEPRPGGAFVTEMSVPGTDGGVDDGTFVPHLNGCFLAFDEGERIVFTTCLVGGFRPATQPFITAEFTFIDHPEGTLYIARALHSTSEARTMHEEFGFYDGWGTVTEQLADFVKRTN